VECGDLRVEKAWGVLGPCRAHWQDPWHLSEDLKGIEGQSGSRNSQCEEDEKEQRRWNRMSAGESGRKATGQILPGLMCLGDSSSFYFVLIHSEMAWALYPCVSHWLPLGVGNASQAPQGVVAPGGQVQGSRGPSSDPLCWEAEVQGEPREQLLHPQGPHEKGHGSAKLGAIYSVDVTAAPALGSLGVKIGPIWHQ
jgi:hypothetical protein